MAIRIAPEMKKVPMSVCITVGELAAWAEFAKQFGGNSAAFRELFKTYRLAATSTPLENVKVETALTDLEAYLQENAPAGLPLVASLRRVLNVSLV